MQRPDGVAVTPRCSRCRWILSEVAPPSRSDAARRGGRGSIPSDHGPGAIAPTVGSPSGWRPPVIDPAALAWSTCKRQRSFSPYRGGSDDRWHASHRGAATPTSRPRVPELRGAVDLGHELGRGVRQDEDAGAVRSGRGEEDRGWASVDLGQQGGPLDAELAQDRGQVLGVGLPRRQRIGREGSERPVPRRSKTINRQNDASVRKNSRILIRATAPDRDHRPGTSQRPRRGRGR
jgi:hypothetical protein